MHSRIKITRQFKAPGLFKMFFGMLPLLVTLLFSACFIEHPEKRPAPTPPQVTIDALDRTITVPSMTTTNTPAPTQTLTITPTITPLPTQTLTPTATVMPVAINQLPVISLTNVRFITRLAVIPGKITTLTNTPSFTENFTLAPDGKIIALDNGSTVTLWDIHSGQKERELIPPDLGSFSTGPLALSPDGKQLARIYTQNRIVIWDVASGEVLRVISSQENGQTLIGLAYSGSGKNLRLVTSGLVNGQPGMLFWDTTSGDLLVESETGASGFDRFVVSPNGRMVVQAGADGVVRFWDGITGQRAGQQIIYACPDSILSVSFNYSGGLLALACAAASDTQARLRIFFYSPNYYRPENMTLFRVLQADSASSGIMAFSVESSLLAVASGSTLAGSRSNRIDLWGFYTHHIEATIPIIFPDVRQIEFSKDGKLMLFSLSDGSVEIWGVTQGLH